MNAMGEGGRGGNGVSLSSLAHWEHCSIVSERKRERDTMQHSKVGAKGQPGQLEISRLFLSTNQIL